MATTKLVRVFMHNKKELKDINPTFTKEQILEAYSIQYPELINSKVTGPKIENNKAVFKFENYVGTKG